MPNRTRPSCRYCDERVRFFGDVCADCEPGHDSGELGIVALADVDASRLTAAAGEA